MHYGTLPGALAYHTARANAAWSAEGVTDPQRTAALVRASTWLDGEYGARFSGAKTGGRSQQLQWPRTGAMDAEDNEIEDDEVPFEVENAVYEAALRELANPGGLTPDIVGTERILREKVGDLETQYADAADPNAAKPVVTIIDGILAGLLVTKATSTIVGFAARA